MGESDRISAGEPGGGRSQGRSRHRGPGRSPAWPSTTCRLPACSHGAGGYPCPGRHPGWRGPPEPDGRGGGNVRGKDGRPQVYQIFFHGGKTAPAPGHPPAACAFDPASRGFRPCTPSWRPWPPSACGSRRGGPRWRGRRPNGPGGRQPARPRWRPGPPCRWVRGEALRGTDEAPGSRVEWLCIEIMDERRRVTNQTSLQL